MLILHSEEANETSVRPIRMCGPENVPVHVLQPNTNIYADREFVTVRQRIV